MCTTTMAISFLSVATAARRATAASRTATKLAGAVVASRLHGTARRDVIFRSEYPDVELVEMSIPDYMLGVSDGLKSKHGDRVALRAGGKQTTYNELKQQVVSVAASLQTVHRVQRGTVIGLFLPNSPAFVTAIHGCLASGAQVTTINPTCTAWELAYQLNDSKATMMVTTPALLPTVLEANKEAGNPIKTIIVDGEHQEGGSYVPFTELTGADPNSWTPPRADWKTQTAVIPYSSGTTGRPKGVELTHFNIVTNVRQSVASGLRLTSSNRLIGQLPFYHIYGLVVVVNLALAAGSSVSCLSKFDPVDFLTTIQNDKLDVLHLVPPLALFLAKHPLVSDYDVSSIREIVCGAAPLSEEVTAQLYSRIPSLGLIRQAYGMTELSPVCHFDRGTKEQTGSGSAGVVVANTVCKVVDLTTGKELGYNESGEVCIKGPQVMKGYLNNEKATRDTIDPDGWLHTGDIGYVAEDGHLYIEDRVKELIKVKANQVAPAELEGVILGHDQVADVCVVQKPDERSGERPKAFVVMRQGAQVSAEELRRWTNQHLSEYKHLVEVEFIDAIPKTASGKILRRILRDKEKEKTLQTAAA